MNKAQNRPTLHKVLSMILALVMVLSLLPLSGFTGSDIQIASDTSADDFYRIVHLDCGRKYFTPEWIKALINEMADAGYNQLQLAFGNKGLRFLLDNMSVTVGEKKYTSENVSSAINAGNKNYYDAGAVNELTQAQMTEIISYAKTKNIEIVPLLNTPFHMEALISAMKTLSASDNDKNVYYGENEACLNLSNETAVSFVKALMQKYVDYFAGQECKFFNFGADEYTGGWDETFYSYAGEIASIITTKGMTPRIFNDSFRTNSSNHVNGVNQVCYWSSNMGYASTNDVCNYANQIINTNQDFYYVVSNSEEKVQSTWSPDSYYQFSGAYYEDTWITYAKTFSNTQYKNFANYNSNASSITPVGSMFCVWCDNPGAKTEQQIAKEIRMILRVIGARMQNSNNYSASSFLVEGGFTADGNINTASADGGSTGGDTGDTTTVTEKSITVSVNGTYSVDVTGTIGSENETYNVDDGTYATYTVKHNEAGTGKPELASSITSEDTYLIGDGTNWLSLSGSSVYNEKDSNAATKWTITGSSSSGYTIKSGNYFLVKSGSGKSTKLDIDSSGYNWSWSTTTGFYAQGQQNSYYLTYSSGWTLKRNTNNGSQPYTEGSPAEATTTITFTGVAVTPENMPAEVTIGNVKYKITVINEDTTGKYIYVNYFITNNRVDGSDGNMSIKIDALDVYGETGKKLSEIVTPTGTYINNDIDTGIAQDVKYYKSVYQLGANVQTTAGWTNKISSGTTAESVRYYGGQWSVYDGSKWVDVEGTTTTDPETYAAGTVSTDVAVITAYYLQKTTVTDEVTTFAADWGPAMGNAAYNTPVFLDFAVKYQSGGDRNPNNFAINNKTTVYNVGGVDNDYVVKDVTNARYIRNIFVENSDDYEVYMITVTQSDSMATMDKNNKSVPTIGYTTADDDEDNNQEKVAWVKSLDDKDYIASVLYGTENQYDFFTAGGDPVVDKIKAQSNASKDYSGYGYLVTYYLREKNANLHVYYVDLTTNELFHDYGITTSSGATFSAEIALASPWKGNLVNGTVTNIIGKSQTVSTDLSSMPSIAANYRYASSYECKRIELKNDNKDLYLYYTFGNNAKYFVVDFGLPLEIPLSKLSDAYTDSTNVTNITVNYSAYGDITTDVANKKFTYTLKDKTFLDKIDKMTVAVTGKLGDKSSTVYYTVNIIPASTVYYEDSFATFTDGKYTANSKETKIEWTTDGTTQANVTQALEALGGENTNVYGYDTAYNNSTKYSLGSAHKVTVTSAMAEDKDNVVWPSATFTFIGTGFDIISLTDNTSGTIFVDVYKGKDTNGERTTYRVCDNYYGYKQVPGEDGTSKWEVDKTSTNALYQIPVISIKDLTYGEYTVLIRPAYSEFFDHTASKGSYTFVLDGIRVYDPMGTNASYVQDGEGYPQYIKLRDKLAGDEANIAGDNKVVFIDGGNTADVKIYANYGPNNEVYLASGQAISFKIPEGLSNLDTVQIGAKSPNGTAMMKVTVGSATDPVNTETISTATEMYYKFTAASGNQVTITNTGNNILSLTNLKLTFTEDPTASTENVITLAAMNTEEQEVAVMAVRALFAAPTPVVETFEPDTFKVSLSKNSISAGQKATLTVKASAEVTSITVNGETYDSYKTRFERSGWGWWSEKTEYHVFTITETPTETTSYDVVAVNDEGAVSEAKTVTLTVKAAQSNWWDNVWNNFFGKWF